MIDQTEPKAHYIDFIKRCSSSHCSFVATSGPILLMYLHLTLDFLPLHPPSPQGKKSWTDHHGDDHSKFTITQALP